MSSSAGKTFTRPEPSPMGYSILDCGPDGALYRYGAGKCPGPLFGANLSGAEAAGGDSIRPTLDDLKGYIDPLRLQADPIPVYRQPHDVRSHR